MKLGWFQGPPSALAQRAARQGWLKWAILFSASSGAILEVVDTSIVNVALPDMEGNLGATLSEIGWVSTGYAMANVVIIPLTAWLGERFGKKRYFIFSLLAFTLASIACGLSSNLTMLVIARVAQGLGGGGLLAKAQSMLFETFPREEQGKATAIFGLGVIVGPAIGPALGGYLTDVLGWRWIFFINLPVGLIAVWMCWIFLPSDQPDHDRPPRVDWLGILLLAGGLATLQAVLEQGQQEDWFSSSLIQNLCVTSVLCSVFFVWRELKVAHPAVDLRVLRYPSLSVGSIFSIMLGMGLYGTLFAIPVFTQGILHFTATQTGVMLIPGALASAAGMAIVGRFSKIVDTRVMIGIGVVMTASVMFNLMSINPGTGQNELFWPLIYRGLGTVMMFLPLSVATLGPIPKADIPASSGFFSLTRQLGGSIGIALITTLVEQRRLVHRGDLVTHVDSGPVTQSRLDAATALLSRHSGDPIHVHQQALSLMDRSVEGQASLLSYIDLFYVVGLLFVLCLPLLFLLGRDRTGTAPLDTY